MREGFLGTLRCPDCSGELRVSDRRARSGDDLVDGELTCIGCGRTYAVESRIPIFVERSSYADGFGWQWNRFQKLQRDSYNGTHIVRDTILRRSGWKPEDLRGKSLLECGCGSGNDTEVLSEMAGTVVSFDLSSAVESQRPEVLARDNVLVMRADINRIPVREESFDIVYCHRVIQHTPDPRRAFASMVRHLRPGGTFFLHSYDLHWKALLHYRYWLRPVTRHLPYPAVFRALTIVGPVLYPVVGLLQRAAFLRIPLKLLVPFSNHDRVLRKNGSSLTRRERYEYSVLITFDALTPRFDRPSSADTLASWFAEEGLVDFRVMHRSPAVVLGRKPLRPGDDAANRAGSRRRSAPRREVPRVAGIRDQGLLPQESLNVM